MINRYKWIKVFLLWLKSREILLLPTVRMAPSSIHDQRLGRWLEASNAAKVGVQHPTIKHRHINKIHVLYIYIITHCIYIYVHIISVPQSPKKSKKLPPKIKEKREKKTEHVMYFSHDFPSQNTKVLPWQDAAPQHDRAWQQCYAASHGCWRSGTKAGGRRGRNFTLGLVDLADFGETTWELNKNGYIYIYICIINGLYSRLYLKFDYWR